MNLKKKFYRYMHFFRNDPLLKESSFMINLDFKLLEIAYLMVSQSNTRGYN